jgi:D-alanine-D-alanine ligase
VIRALLLFGGRSPEHHVSVSSAASIANAAPKGRIQIIPMCIAADGYFVAPERSARILGYHEGSAAGDTDFSFETWLRTEKPDIAFPVIHGAPGEDGTLQGYLDILGVPYAGSGVGASAIGMDKAHMKRVFAAAKLPMLDFIEVHEREWHDERERVVRSVHNALRLPYFVKPANGSGSIGVTKVKGDADLGTALQEAFELDDKAIVERGAQAREIAVGLLGNDDVDASVAGEIVPRREFYDAAAKNLGEVDIVVPAKLPKEKAAEVRRLATDAFRAIGASGFARVDFFLERGTNRVYINEINTLPRLMDNAIFAAMWEATEWKFSRLVERIIELGLERAHARAKRLEGTARRLINA